MHQRKQTAWATSARPPLGPALLPLAPCPGAGSSHGTCVLWLPEGSVQREPMQVTGGAHESGELSPSPGWACPAPRPQLLTAVPTPHVLASRAPLSALTLQARDSQVLSCPY